jgi:hypothetical protein
LEYIVWIYKIQIIINIKSIIRNKRFKLQLKITLKYSKTQDKLRALRFYLKSSPETDRGNTAAWRRSEPGSSSSSVGLPVEL